MAFSVRNFVQRASRQFASSTERMDMGAHLDYASVLTRMVPRVHFDPIPIAHIKDEKTEKERKEETEKDGKETQKKK